MRLSYTSVLVRHDEMSLLVMQESLMILRMSIRSGPFDTPGGGGALQIFEKNYLAFTY